MQNHITNKVILIGTLMNAGRRDRREAAQSRRTETGATVEAFGLELLSPYGEVMVITLEGSKQTPGADLITKAAIGKPIAVEGVIRRRVVTDRRYSVADGDTGVRRAEAVIAVECIREPHEDEPLNRSLVILEGTISVAPRFGQHRSMLANQMARTILQVAHRRQGGWGSTQFGVTEQMDVQIATPIAAAAYALYVPGNQVKVMGELDLSMVPQTRNQAATNKLGQLDAEWPEAKARIVESIQDEQERERQLRFATRKYRNQRAALEQAPMLGVVVGHVELLQGSEATSEQVAEIQREQQRARRTRRPNPQIPARVQNETLATAVESTPAEQPTLEMQPSEPVDITPSTTSVQRPRRIARREEQIDSALNGVAELG